MRPADLEAFPYNVAAIARSSDGKPYEKRKPKRLTCHQSLAGAIAQARIFNATGRLSWIEGTDTATKLEKSKSPATSQRLAGRNHR